MLPPSSIPSSPPSPGSPTPPTDRANPRNAVPSSPGQPNVLPASARSQPPNLNPSPSFPPSDSDDDIPLAQLHAASVQRERTDSPREPASVHASSNTTTRQVSDEHVKKSQVAIQNQRERSSGGSGTIGPTNAFAAGRLRVPRQARLRTNQETLNCVQNLPEFIHDACMGLLEYSKQLSQSEFNAVQCGRPETITKNELAGLVNKAKKRKRNRVPFFNSGDGKKLRLEVMNHPHIEGSLDIYCALCGQNRHANFRGHRTKQKCGYCDVNLCVKVRQGFDLSCWDWWHNAQKLVLRTPTRTSQINKGNHVGDPQNGDNVDEAPALKGKTLVGPARASKLE